MKHASNQLNDSILLFVIIVLLLAFDFWTVKNVSGRLLVGLRWWNETGEDGNSIWVFETRKTERVINATDSRVFWLVLYMTPIVWLFFAFIAIIKLHFIWLLLVLIAIILNLANVVAFTRCDKDAKRKEATNLAGGMIGALGGVSITQRIFGGVLGRFFG